MINCLRFLGMSDFREINAMTLYEYELRMKAQRLREIDKEYEIHLQAWANHSVQATRRQGKDKAVPVYKTFKQFYDYEKYVRGAMGVRKNRAQEERLKRIAVRVREYERGRLESGELQCTGGSERC